MTAENNGTSVGLQVVVDEGGTVVTVERAPATTGLTPVAARRLQATQNINEWRRRENEKIDRERKEKLRRSRNLAGDASDHIEHRWLRLDALKPSPTAQRNLDANRALGYGEDWKWELCKSLSVVQVGENEYEIIDGQHRWWGAWATFPPEQLMPCDVLISVKGDVAKSNNFIDSNQSRRGLTAETLFAQMLLAHRPEALAVVRVLGEFGLTIKTNRDRHNAHDGEAAAGATLLRLVQRIGEPGLREVLGMLNAGWGVVAAAYTAPVLLGMTQFLARYHDDPNFRPDLFIKALSKPASTPLAVEVRAMSLLAAFNGKRADAMSCALHESYNDARASAVRQLKPFQILTGKESIRPLLAKYKRSAAQRAMYA
ncbi:MAG TPA: hypothetical protein VNM48_14330 [Chloroflexota bacterium]|nr:hypothetical protein [Chloroflexota bacterium]